MPVKQICKDLDIVVPNVYIPAQDLVAWLKELKKPIDVRATNKDWEFKDLEDIINNPAQLAGTPTLHIGNDIRIYFWQHRARISVPFYGDMDLWRKECDLAHRFEEFIKHYQKRVLLFPEHFAFISVYISLMAGLQIIDKVFGAAAALAAFAVLLALSAWFLAAVIAGKRPPVSYNPRETFWQKNKNAILTGIIVAIVTALVTAFIPQITNLLG